MTAPVAPPRLKVSVVVPTYNRPDLLKRLLTQLGDQTLPPAEYEVVVVDDGSAEPVHVALEGVSLPCALRVERQQNAGAAAARHRGIVAARGEIVVMVDDDMQVGREFVEEHLRAHPPGSSRAVLGAIRPLASVQAMPLFERWHQKKLDDFVADARARGSLRGNELYTGNLSLRREDYVSVGGFATGLTRSEDTELGLRLEQRGVQIGFSEAAYSVNGSDHTSLARWRRTAARYGAVDAQIARMHPGLRHASPWRYFAVTPALTPVLVGPSLAPQFASALGAIAYSGATIADRLGLRRVAFSATGLTYALDYFRGLRTEMGALPMLVDLLEFALGRQRDGPGRAALLVLVKRMLADIRADHEMLLRYEAKYGNAGRTATAEGRLATDAIQKIGLQMMIAIRIMRLLRDAGPTTLGAKVMSRLIRHVYGSHIHWDAEFEPGIVIGHTFAIAISSGARIGSGCILMHGVSIGLGNDPVTGESGSPRLERNVHVGPLSKLFGPIVIGEGTKIQAGSLVTRSVPPYSAVMAPQPEIVSRKAGQGPQVESAHTVPSAPAQTARA